MVKLQATLITSLYYLYHFIYSFIPQDIVTLWLITKIKDTFTFPSKAVAWWTWPIDADAKGFLSKKVNLLFHSVPK